MGSLKAEKRLKKSLAPKRAKTKKKKDDNQTKSIKKKKDKNKSVENNKNDDVVQNNDVKPASASELLSFFLNQFQSANAVQLSSLELDSIKGFFFFFGFLNWVENALSRLNFA